MSEYSRFNKFFLSALMLVVATAAGARDKMPEVSHDGLHLVHDSKLRVVYMKPGADLNEYDKIALLDCYVAFRKNYKRDHNRDEPNLEMRINDKEMAKIRKELALEFNKEFTKVLSTEGGHQMVTEGATGAIIGRVIDPEAAGIDGMAQVRNIVTNKADADRVLRRWAKILNDHLAHVKSKS